MGFLKFLRACGYCPDCSPNPCDPPAPVITSAVTAAGTQCKNFSYQITAMNSPTSFSATGLPAGLSCNTSTGEITGVPTVSITTSVTVSATNACGTGSQSVTFLISQADYPSLTCDAISASLTKCGYEAYDGSNHVYLTNTLSGAIRRTAYASAAGSCIGCVQIDVYTFSSTCTFDSASCSETINGNVNLHTEIPCGTTSSDTDGACCDPDSVLPTETGWLHGTTQTTSYALPDAACYTATTDYKWTSAGTTPTSTLSDEYTTALLKSNTIAALPSYPGTFGGTCSALYDLSVDERTFSIRRFKYKFILPTMTGYVGYKISWLQGSTPYNYTWNGFDTETPVYGPIDEPTSNGTIGISNIVVTCS